MQNGALKAPLTKNGRKLLTAAALCILIRTALALTLFVGLIAIFLILIRLALTLIVVLVLHGNCS